jgi:restriction system protein
MQKQLWVVRAGRDGVYVQDFLDKAMVAIGWSQSGDLTGFQTREQVAAALIEAFPEYSKFQLSMNAGQVHRFLCELVPGEMVLTYDPDKRLYHLGTVTGNYVFHSDYDVELRHTRAVKWTSEFERDRLTAATKNSLGSIATIFRASEDASEEVLGLIAVGPAGAKSSPSETDEEASDEELEVRQDTEQRAREFLQDRLDKLSWDDMQRLVAGLLRALGYKTRISPPGPDRGKDIIASPDALGFVAPRIVTEVKHRKGTMGAPDVRAFAGGLRNHDNGLYVSTGGFTREARYEADRANHPLTLMDSADLVEAIMENYDRMDLETRTLLPLKKIYWPA